MEGAFNKYTEIEFCPGNRLFLPPIQSEYVLKQTSSFLLSRFRAP